MFSWSSPIGTSQGVLPFARSKSNGLPSPPLIHPLIAKTDVRLGQPCSMWTASHTISITARKARTESRRNKQTERLVRVNQSRAQRGDGGAGGQVPRTRSGAASVDGYVPGPIARTQREKTIGRFPRARDDVSEASSASSRASTGNV
jgi:hypothetical protein